MECFLRLVILVILWLGSHCIRWTSPNEFGGSVWTIDYSCASFLFSLLVYSYSQFLFFIVFVCCFCDGDGLPRSWSEIAEDLVSAG